MFSERVKFLREKMGLTQEKLASGIGLSRPAIAKYEGNERQPDFDILIEFADFFGVTTDYLTGRSAFMTFDEELNYRNESKKLLNTTLGLDQKAQRSSAQIIDIVRNYFTYFYSFNPRLFTLYSKNIILLSDYYCAIVGQVESQESLSIDDFICNLQSHCGVIKADGNNYFITGGLTEKDVLIEEDPEVIELRQAVIDLIKDTGNEFKIESLRQKCPELFKDIIVNLNDKS